MSKLYGFGDYDKQFTLKISAELWLVIAYLMRPFIAVLSSFRMGRGGGGDSGVDRFRLMLYPDDFSLMLGILTTVPVLLVFFAYARRKPASGPLLRAIWHKGAALLALAAVFNIALVFIPLLTGAMTRVHMAGWIQVGLATAILVYLFMSRRVRDTFQDFPSENKQ